MRADAAENWKMLRDARASARLLSMRIASGAVVPKPQLGSYNDPSHSLSVPNAEVLVLRRPWQATAHGCGPF